MISVIIPLYNIDKEYVIQCCESLKRQRVQEIEYIFIDDCSTERLGVEVVEEYSAKDNRFILIELSENKGVSEARNEGIRKASGEYIYFLDSDDWVRDNYFFDIQEILNEEENRNADFLILGSDTLFCNRSKTAMIQLSNVEEIIMRKEELRDAQIQIMEFCKKYPSINFGTMVMKLYKKSFLFDNNLLCISGIKKEQDCVFNLYALSCADMVRIVNISGYNYRINPKSICHKYNENISSIYLNTIEHYYNFARKNDLSNEAYFYCLWTLNTIFNLDFYNKYNKKCIRKRINEFVELLNKPQYQEALSKINLENVKVHNRIMVHLLREKKYYLYWVLYLIRYKMKIGTIIIKLRNVRWKLDG